MHNGDKLDPNHMPLGKPNMVNPAKLSHEKSSQACGQCHSVFEFYDEKSKNEFMAKDGFAFRPGDELTDSRHVFRMGKDKDPVSYTHLTLPTKA